MTDLQTLAWFTDPWTYALVVIVALLLFGKRLPEVGRSLGRGIAEFKKGLHDVQDELTREEPHPPPPQNKLQPPAYPPAQLPPNHPAPPSTSSPTGPAGGLPPIDQTVPEPPTERGPDGQ